MKQEEGTVAFNELDSERQGQGLIMKLSKAQERVMSWMSKGWRARRYAGSAVEINGKRVCNSDTMAALERAGLVYQDSQWTWQATTAGRDWKA